MARVLVAGPHPDDQELGMGGAIIRLANQGHDVLLLDLTNGEPTPLGDPETRRGEAGAALEILRRGATGSVERVCLGLTNRELTHDLESRHLVAAAIRAWRAEIVFTPYPEDAHPDHRAGTRIVEDARFDAKLSKVEMPAPVDNWTGEKMRGPGVTDGGQTEPVYPKWLFYYYATHLRWVADPNFVIDTSGLVDQKIESIEAYKTQFVLPEKNRRVVEWVRSAADYFGSRIGAAAGEPFFTKEPIRLGSLEGLLG
ncbi:MAG: PIG-L family deacetylase [Planctomycetota bacterium]